MEEASEEQQLLAIFPMEIWTMILDKITDHNELERLSNVFPFFRQVLLPNRVLFLFPKVWKIMNMKYHKMASMPPPPRSPYSKDDFEVNETIYGHCNECEKFTPNWWKSATFNFRVACKSWSSSVDQMLQVLPTCYDSAIDRPENDAICVKYFDNQVVYVDNAEYFTYFLEHFETSHPPDSIRSPFLRRSLGLDFSVDDDVDEDDLVHFEHIPNEIMALLQKYGHHIWYNDTIWYPNRHVYTEMKKLLDLLPNVKALRFCYGDPENVPRLSSEEINQLQSEIQQQNLPKLKKLEELCVSNLPSPIFNELIKQNNHLKKLKIAGQSTNNYNLLQVELPNLISLAYNVQNRNQLYSLEDPKIKWPLQSLALNLDKCYLVDLSRVFNLLGGKWGNSLTNLELSLPSSNDDEVEFAKESLLLKLNLPKVVDLKLEFGNATNFDFLLPMKESLEYLQITVDYNHPKEIVDWIRQMIEWDSVVKLVTHSSELLESNVFTLFPKLKEIEFCEIFKEDDEVVTEEFQANRREWRQKVKSQQ